MINTKKLIKMARKWQKLAAASRKRISWSRTVAEKGHFVVYTSDKRRFMIPLTYIRSEIFTELFRMAEEEFGVAASGPIVLPCDSSFMEYAISMIQRHVSEDLEKALIMSMNTCRYSVLSNDRKEHINQQMFICSF
ncbi:auxin-responsive protein SAUR65-like [Amaranthus tricolor]|uniref:auxin-responsive protein SAUR65-like n=1 Tax=Amaranthus tricolor TaxID=29722 RepID=UPI00258AF5C6|nr:auxin-responsive protein SAUR65-like [Amaranthus tricolor]XP_057517015.1 auxin-responsive protein SAUR65-like [Amaranthus tricolor]